MLHAELKRSPTLIRAIKPYLTDGINMPEQIINQLVQNRLLESDCVVNGWVLEGFPCNESQMNLLTAMRITPSIVFQLDQRQDIATERFSKKKIDPVTGLDYNLGISLVYDPSVKERLIKAPECNPHFVKNGFAAWNANLSVLEDYF